MIGIGYHSTLAATHSQAAAIADALPSAAETWDIPRPYRDLVIAAAKSLRESLWLALQAQMQQQADLDAIARRDEEAYLARHGYDADADLADDWDDLAYAREERER